ncbi:MAG: hypothetical protein IH623_32380 [Verrucomicrobia bacterium]|nr:hypothetical protein [Verrucomicrobiota bacterium]
MDKDFYRAEETNTSNFASEIESRISGARVRNIGNGQLVVMLDSGAVATVYPVTGETCDMFAKSADNEDVDLKDVSWQECLNVLQKLSDSNDPGNWWNGKFPQGHQSASIEPVSTAKAFSQAGQKTNRATEQSQREGWQRIGEEKDRDQTGRKDARDYPRGEDPLGRLDRPKRTDEQSAVQVPQDLFAYLREMLPMEPEQITMDDAGQITLNLDTARIEVISQGHLFGVKTFVDGDQQTETDKISAGDLIRYLFGIVDKIQTRLALGMEDPNPIDDVSPNDAYSVLKELAVATGAYGGDDILRNKSLTDLKQGLCVARSPFTGRRFAGNDFNSGHTADNEVSASLKGEPMHDGKPVSINENRDASKPYADTLGGKKLVYLPGIGATLVDKSQLPPKKKLSWDAQHGIILADENAPPPDRRNMWKHHWQP